MAQRVIKNLTSPKNIAAIKRKARIFSLRESGLSYGKILAVLQSEMLEELPKHYSERHVYSDVQSVLQVMRDTVSESLLEVAVLESQRLDVMLNALWPQVESGSTKAIDTALHVMDRRAKLLGLDAAIRVDWRVELSGFLDAKVLTITEIRNTLGEDLFANFLEFRTNHTLELIDQKRNEPLLYVNKGDER